jgi:arginyl-tRNA synthetase
MSRTITNAQRLLPDEALQMFAGVLDGAIAARYPKVDRPAIAFEAPRRPEFGDFSANVAFGLAKAARKSPQDVAVQLVADIRSREPQLSQILAAIEPVAGFINLRLAPACWQAAVAQVLREGENFGQSPPSGRRVSLEFGSANPTGPLLVVQGRALSIGDLLARTMRFYGHDVFVEWIINDAGGQLDTLGRSLYARYRQQFDASFPFPEDGYPGDYLIPLARAIRERDGERWVTAPETEWLEPFTQFARDQLVEQQRKTAIRFGVRYDHWQSERELHEAGHVRAGLQRLTDLGFTYEQEGAVFFRATQFGDDKDRVLVRADGRPTYLCADVAYHYDKLQRADRVIDILGPDHHGYIGRLQGLAAALGYEGHLDVLIAQQITLMRGTEQASSSKRAGQIVELDDVLDEVGVDAARFFFILPAPESPMVFDLSLAKEQTLDNPVYYVQYGHARIASVLRNAAADDIGAARDGTADLQTLAHSTELALARRLAEMPRLVRSIVESLATQRLARYARDVAGDFHQFYTECKILTDDAPLRRARLGLCIATKTVLARVLDLAGVTAPESM